MRCAWVPEAGSYNGCISPRMSTRESTIAVEPQALRGAPVRAGLFSLTLLCLGHFCVDLYSGALGALQPLLVQKLHTSLTQVGILGGVLVFASSVMQPVYGYLSDRFHTRLFTVLAPAVAGVFISSLGLAPSYGWLLLLVLLGGTGIAAFHPQASARAVLGAPEKRARAMAVFVSAGSLGYRAGAGLLLGDRGAVGFVTDVLGGGARYPGVPVGRLFHAGCGGAGGAPAAEVRLVAAAGGLEAAHHPVLPGVPPFDPANHAGAVPPSVLVYGKRVHGLPCELRVVGVPGGRGDRGLPRRASGGPVRRAGGDPVLDDRVGAFPRGCSSSRAAGSQSSGWSWAGLYFCLRFR